MTAPDHASRVPRRASQRGPMRVLALCDHVGFEGKLHGSGRVMVEMASHFRAADVELVACVLQAGGALEEKLHADGVPIRFLGFGRFDPRQVAALVRLILSERIDIVHAWDFGAATYGRLAALLTSRKSIVHVQSHHSAYQRRGFPGYARFAFRALAPATARAIAIAPSIRDFAVEEMGFRHDQIVMIPNPAPPTVGAPVPAQRVAELRQHYGLAESTPVVGSLTRFYEAKGLRYLVEALPRIAEACPAARVLLVGDGPLRQELERQAEELGVRDRIIFAGFQHDVIAHLRLFTVMTMPSLEEGMPLAALEALAAGVPMVTTDVGGLPEVLGDGRAGFLVEPRDAVALANAIVRVLTDDALRARLREGCRAQHELFSFEQYSKSLAGLYREVLARP